MMMKKRKLLSIAPMFFACLASSSLHAQPTVIARDWRFKTGDSLQWAAPTYKDAHWDNMKAGLWWAHAGYDYSGFAWYRKQVIIPSSLKPTVESLGYLKFSLGQIQDADQAFLNGQLIGQTGSFSPFEGRWGEPRTYFVKTDQVRWDAPNTIAVRVYGPNNNGGMHTGPYFFEPYKITFKDFVSMKGQSTAEEGKNEREFTVAFRNKSNEDFKGVLAFQVKDTAGKILESKRKDIIITKGENAPSTFQYTLPGEGIYYITSVFTEAQTGGTLQKEVIVSTIKNVLLPVGRQPLALVQNKIKDVFVSAPFEDQKIQGYLGDRMNINLVKRLLQVDEQELLAGYLDRPGKQNWVGEHIGKYLETASSTWRYTHHAALKAQMDRMLFVLLHTQLPNGYLGTYTPENYWTNWDVWSHKYNLVGLLAYYKATGYTPALEAAKRIGNLLCKTFGNKPGQLDIITSGTHVGMASASVLDPIVDLYRMTGDKKYLDFAHYIVRSYNEPDGPGIIRTLLEVGKVNKVANGKAYEMLSNLVGILKLYKVTGEAELLKAAQIAWRDIVQNRLYVTGTASSYELFRDDSVLPAGEEAHMGEGCVTTTWVQFNYQLFTLTGDAKYLDQLERSAYNHLLGAENPQSGCVSYYTSLQDKKPYSCGITCCLSSVPRGISMIPLFNYGKRAGVPTILLHESELLTDTIVTKTGSRVPFTIQASGYFPAQGKTTYIVSPSQPVNFPLAIRVPQWAANFTATIDGNKYTGAADQYLTINRQWRNGDRIEVAFDMPVQIIPGGKSYPNRIAIQRGPQVLSVDSSLNQPFQPLIPATQVSNPSRLQLQVNTGLLPSNWVGKQVYSVTVPFAGEQSKTMLLVPFADASQTGAKAEVWIPVAKVE
jgi:DUF1680 family protein